MTCLGRVWSAAGRNFTPTAVGLCLDSPAPPGTFAGAPGFMSDPSEAPSLGQAVRWGGDTL